MSAREKKLPANDASLQQQTVPEQVLEIFYQALAEKPEYKDIAERFRKEPGRSEDAVRRALFGDDA